MSVVETQKILEPVQRDGRRRARCRFVFSEGDIEEFDFNMLPAGTDVDALIVNKTPIIEADMKARELVRAEEFLLNGGSLTAVQNNKKYNTNAEIGAYLLKRLANRLGSVSRQTLEKDLPALFLLRNLFDEVTDAQIASLLAVSLTDVTAWRLAFTAMRDGIASYSHDLPSFPEVEP